MSMSSHMTSDVICDDVRCHYVISYDVGLKDQKVVLDIYNAQCSTPTSHLNANFLQCWMACQYSAWLCLDFYLDSCFSSELEANESIFIKD